MITVFELVLKRILKQKVTLMLMILFPFALLILPQPQDMETPTLSFGIFGLVILFSAFLLSKQVIEDRQYKTIVRISASPLSHKSYLLGHLGAYFFVLSIQITGFWLVGLMVWQAPLTFYLFTYLLLLFFTMMSISFCLFWHTFFKTYGTSISIFSIAANLMAVIGGLSFPLMYLPDRLRRIAVVLPTYWYAYGLEQATEKMYQTVLLCLLILLGFAIIFISIGSKRRFE